MKLLLRVLVLLFSLLALGAIFAWNSVTMNVPWKSMLQQMTLLPAWLDPSPMTVQQVNSRLTVPEGYGISLFAGNIADARMLRVTSEGDVLVSTPRDGQILLLEADENGDGAADGERVLLSGLNRPNGIDLWDDYLYVGEEDGIGRVTFDAKTGSVGQVYERVIDGLPPGGGHWKKTIRFGPDGFLYIAVGSSCNACLEEDERRGAILRYTPDGDFIDIYAKGLRNSAGFDWAPDTGALYATDNGRDLLGDNFPPCELNEIVESGFYGWPFVNGANVRDPDLGLDHPTAIETSIPPTHEFGAHNAPLGIVFLRDHNHHADYQRAAIVALHGSWNRTKKDGYKVVSLHFAADGGIEERDFLTGFLVDDTAVGRPAEVAEGPDGSIYVSDDFGSAIYQVKYRAESRLSIPLPREVGSAGYDPTNITSEERATALASGPAVIVREDCLACHGESSGTESTQILLTNLNSRYTVNELTDYLMVPRPPMPPYGIDDKQRRELAIYLLETY